MKACHKCGEPWDGVVQPGVKEVCPKCGEDLHICLNCSLFDEHKPYQCKETDIDPVMNKERSNFCDYFRFSENKALGAEVNKKADTRTALDKLFKK